MLEGAVTASATTPIAPPDKEFGDIPVTWYLGGGGGLGAYAGGGVSTTTTLFQGTVEVNDIISLLNW